MLDVRVANRVKETGVYPATLIDDLHAGAFYTIRAYELAPYVTKDSVEGEIQRMLKDGRL